MTVEIPSPLSWVVAKLVELLARGFTGNVTISMKPGSPPIVKVEEVFREDAQRK